MPEDNEQFEQENTAKTISSLMSKTGGRHKVKVKVGRVAKKPVVKKTKKAINVKEKLSDTKAGKAKEGDTLTTEIIVPTQQLPAVKSETEDNVGKKENLAAARDEIKREIAASGSNPVKISDYMPKEQKDFVSRLAKAGVIAKTPPSVNNQKITDSGGAEAVITEDKKNKRPLRLYRNIALTFILAAIILAIVIGYFAFVQVTIFIVSNQENINDSLIFDVYDQTKNTTVNGNAVLGLVKKASMTVAKNFPATGIDVVGEEAVGTATIISSYDKNQPLVATTRLLTPDGKLFRIKETVNVPAGGSVVVPIYADQPSKDMAVGPTRFTIPGLWAGLQDKIYAQSDQPIVYQQKAKKHITSEDIANSIVDLKQEALKKAQAEASSTEGLNKVIISVDEATIKDQTDAKIGVEQDNFDASMSVDVTIVAFNEEKVKTLAKQKFILSLPENKEVVSFSDNNIGYTLNNSDWERGVATLNASYVGKTTLKNNSNIIDVNKVLGLNKDQLKAYLTSLPDVAGYEIKFTPSWLWKVPQFIEPSKIHVEIKK
jgi:hypothetical protein